MHVCEEIDLSVQIDVCVCVHMHFFMWSHALCAHVHVAFVWIGSARKKHWLKCTVIWMSDRPSLLQSLGTSYNRIECT